MVVMNTRSFYFVRHGETDWNKEHIFQGPNDVPLNDLGRQQAMELNNKIQGLDITHIFSSPLSRAKETADILAGPRNINVEIINELAECQSAETAKYLLRAKEIVNMPSFERMPENTESPKDFIDRVYSGLDMALSLSHGQTPLIVAHGGTCGALFEKLNLQPVKTPNCCLFCFKYVDGKYSLEQLY